ncbi:hypothetical protein ACFL2K_00945 [Candidatus Margulisiibacteriota bacterium]
MSETNAPSWGSKLKPGENQGQEAESDVMDDLMKAQKEPTPVGEIKNQTQEPKPATADAPVDPQPAPKAPTPAPEPVDTPVDPQPNPKVPAPMPANPQPTSKAPVPAPAPVDPQPNPKVPTPAPEPVDAPEEPQSAPKALAPIPAKKLPKPIPVPAKENSVAVPGNDTKYFSKEGIAFGTDKIQLEDCNLPQLILVQSTTQKYPNHIGKFYHSLEKKSYEKIQAVMLFMDKSRRLFPGNYKGAPLCGSDDVVAPISRFKGIFSDFCASCPKAMWDDSVQPAKKPECVFMYNYPIFFTDDIGKETIAPATFAFSKSQIIEAKKWNSLIKSENIPYFYKVVEITSFLKKSDLGSAYIPIIQVVRDTTPEERAWCLRKAKEAILFNLADSINQFEE